MTCPRCHCSECRAERLNARMQAWLVQRERGAADAQETALLARFEAIKQEAK